jgi:uncharacterized membrane protein YfcA
MVTFILVAADILAGVIDALAGGGLIILLVMMLVGISPIDAIGPDKLQAGFSELTALCLLQQEQR